ncbi:MAG TPA: SDR family NAD(P)-dependent oxidoreductase, partial [Draconibacterium sp.]|nr:SDR family NAD(P)-dependent oxidoreductase [Draconibacterium sp.]
MFSVKNKNIVITGGSGVIGSAISVALAQNGATVVLLGRNKQKLQYAFDKIAAYGQHHMQFVCDVLDTKSLEAVKDKIHQQIPQIDVLINVAGGAAPGASTKTEFLTPDTPFEDSIFGINLSDFKYTTDLNFTGSVIPIKVFAETMAKRQNGNIINISSMGAIQPLSKSPAYSAGKAAISNFTQ